MRNQPEYDLFLDNSLDRAVEEFRTSPLYAGLQQREAQMLLQCHMTLHSEEEEFVFECFALLQELLAHEERFVYRRGLLDGVAQLKALGVIE